MDEISKHDFQPETPCIKVVGVGETVAPVIESLKDNWKGDIDAGMADECKPADTDIMAIVVSDGDAETTHKVIDAFHGILTIVVVTESAEIEGFDILIDEIGRWFGAIKVRNYEDICHFIIFLCQSMDSIIHHLCWISAPREMIVKKILEFKDIS